MASEVQAVKTEIMEAIKRRFTGDTRSPADMFGITSTAVAEVMADMVFAAAKDEAHANRLMSIIGMSIKTRWNHLASSK